MKCLILVYVLGLKLKNIGYSCNISVISFIPVKQNVNKQCLKEEEHFTYTILDRNHRKKQKQKQPPTHHFLELQFL